MVSQEGLKKQEDLESVSQKLKEEMGEVEKKLQIETANHQKAKEGEFIAALRDTNQPISTQDSHHVTQTNQSEHCTHTTWHKPANQYTVLIPRDINQPIITHYSHTINQSGLGRASQAIGKLRSYVKEQENKIENLSKLKEELENKVLTSHIFSNSHKCANSELIKLLLI